jgi:hypothetical protein
LQAKAEVPRDALGDASPPISITRLSQWESAARVMVAEMMILAGGAETAGVTALTCTHACTAGWIALLTNGACSVQSFACVGAVGPRLCAKPASTPTRRPAPRPAGEAAGAFGSSRALPLPYRGQAAPKLPPPEALAALPPGPCTGYALRKCMTRSATETSPVAHASLALDAYVQVGQLRASTADGRGPPGRARWAFGWPA